MSCSEQASCLPVEGAVRSRNDDQQRLHPEQEDCKGKHNQGEHNSAGSESRTPGQAICILGEHVGREDKRPAEREYENDQAAIGVWTVCRSRIVR
jgi:hypothetical protein